ncbi:MAG: YfcE family phosphodiesterase [Patescibacteria group bacterium]|nr:YfcE family phosphodiesterase [Patescibacteria group bacterium]
MKLAIISDIHDNLSNLDKTLKWCKENAVEALLICGDLTSNETVDYLVEYWPWPIYIVQGNGCFYDRKKFKEKKDNLIDLGRYGGVTDIGSLKIGLVHEPKLIENLLKLKPEIIFYGHTHKPWTEKTADGVELVNPGNLDGSRYPATFATFSTLSQSLKLIRLDEIK